MKRIMLIVWTLAFWAGVGAVVHAATSADYVQGGLIAHWDGIDNTLTDGVRSHTENATVWSDLAGLNDVTLPACVTVEDNAMYSEASTSKKAGTDYPKLTSLQWKSGSTTNKFSGLQSGVPAFTVEVVSERGNWTKSDNYNNIQAVFQTPRGSIGYRQNKTNGFYLRYPFSTKRHYIRHFLPENANATEIHALSVDLGNGEVDSRERFFMDGVDVWAKTELESGYNTYTLSWGTYYAMFGNLRANLRIYAIRVYRRPLSAYERARNHQIDLVRFFGVEKPSFVAKELLDVTYTGAALEPEPVVVNPITEEVLIKGTDYTLAYANNVEPGTATITVTGMGDWEGSSLVLPFTIAARDSYLELAYIESSGTQFIDTDYLPNPTTKMELKLMFDGAMDRTAELTGSSPFGCIENSGAVCFSMNFGGESIDDEKIWTWFSKSGGTIKMFQITGLRETKQTFKIDAATGKGSYGPINFTAMAKTTTHTVNTLRLFGRCENDGAVRPFNYCKMRVYGCKIWDGDMLVRDFIPCRASDMRVGLYDRVNGRFYENEGLDEFSFARKQGVVIIVR